MATTGNLDNKPILVSEMRKYVGDISAHARGGNTLKATKTGAMVSVDDAYAGALLKLTAYGNSVQNGTPTPESPVEIKSVHAISAVASGRNLLRLTAQTKTINGVTFTVNDDGTIVANGTATATTEFQALYSKVMHSKGGTYHFSGCPSGGSSSTYRQRVFRNGENGFSVYDEGNGGSLTVTDAQASLEATLSIMVYSGQTVTNLVFRPQLTAGSEAYSFVPYVAATTPLTLVDSDGNTHELKKLGTYQDKLVLNADGSGTIIENVADFKFNLSRYIGEDKNVTDGSLIGFIQSGGAYHESAYIKYGDWQLAKSNMSTVAQAKTSANTFTLGAGDNGRGYVTLILNRSTAGSVDAFKTWLSTHDAHFYVPLVSPITYHIPAINMPSLPDLVSNCWLSATDASGAAIPCEVGIEYRRDINKVIEDIETAIADIVSA